MTTTFDLLRPLLKSLPTKDVGTVTSLLDSAAIWLITLLEANQDLAPNFLALSYSMGGKNYELLIRRKTEKARSTYISHMAREGAASGEATDTSLRTRLLKVANQWGIEGDAAMQAAGTVLKAILEEHGD